MASVEFTRLFLHDGLAPADYIAVEVMSQATSPTVRGATRTYAGGRRRAVRQAGAHEPVAWTFTALDRVDWVWLAAHVGEFVMFREPAGRKAWGHYWSLDTDDHEDDGRDLLSCSIQFDPISFDEAV